MMNNKTKTMTLGAMLAITMVVAMGSTAISFSGNHYALAQEVPTTTTITQEENIISVTGTATTSVEPDLLIVTFGVETQEITAKESLDANTQLMNSTITVI